MKVAIVGDLNVDMESHAKWRVAKGSSLILKDVELLPGGVAGNMGCILKQLSIEPVIFGAVGEDYWGKFVRRELRRAGLTTKHIALHHGPTGFFIIVVSQEGQRTMIGTRAANAKLRITSRILRQVRPDWVHISGYSLLGEQGPSLLERAKSASRALSVPLSIDLEGLSETDLQLDLRGAEVLCNRTEYNDYFESDMKKVAASFTGPIVVKAGPEGCYLLSGGEVKHVRTTRVEVQDSTGAGDAFNAGYVAARMMGGGLVAACMAGNLLGSEKVKHEGARLKLTRASKERVWSLASSQATRRPD